MFDNSQPIGYNDSNDLYAAVAENYLTRPHVIKMDEQAPVNDIGCKHEVLIPNPDDTIGDAVYHGCTNYKCGIGFYIRPTK